MCYILYNKETNLSQQQKDKIFNFVEKQWDQNPDGVGVCVWQDNQWNINKSLLNDKIKQLIKNTIYSNNIYIIHLRKSSAGNNNIDNCHPIDSNGPILTIHNGTERDYDPNDNNHSDTWNINRKLNDNSLTINDLRKMSSRFLIFKKNTNPDDVEIINKISNRSNWVIKDKIWNSGSFGILTEKDL